MAYAELNGIRLYHQVHGQGEALVLIPGMAADHTAWVRQPSPSGGATASSSSTPGASGGPAGSDLSAVDTRKTMNALIALSFKRWPYRTAMQLLSRLFLRREMFDGLSDQAAASAGHSTIDRLHLIQAPTLLLTGTGDRIIRPQASERLAAGIPGAKLVMVKDGSHALNVEMASRFNREVLGFLQAGETGRSGR